MTAAGLATAATVTRGVGSVRAGAPAGIVDPVIGAAGTGDEVGTTAELGEGAEMAALGTGGPELSPKSGPDSAGLPA
ncbi:MAG: hypothetical protein WAP49_01760, partial [Mycobacterium sp.]